MIRTPTDMSITLHKLPTFPFSVCENLLGENNYMAAYVCESIE